MVHTVKLRTLFEASDQEVHSIQDDKQQNTIKHDENVLLGEEGDMDSGTVGQWDSGTVSNYLKKKRKTGVHFTVTKELMQIPCLPKIIREIHLLVDFFG